MPNVNNVLSDELITSTIEEKKYIPSDAIDHMTTEEFRKMYGLNAIINYEKGKELLYFLFGNRDHNENSLTYALEFNRKITSYYGEAKSGNAQNKIVNYSKGSWNHYKQPIDENKAIEIAYDVRNALRIVLEKISENTNATEVRDLINQNRILTTNNWLKKYLTILYPDKFMPMLNGDWTSRIFCPLGLTPSGDWFNDAKAFSEKAKEFGIDSVAFYHVIFKCATEQIKNELKELGIETSQLAATGNLLVNTRSAFNDIKAGKWIKSEDLQTKFEKYLSQRYNWDSEPESKPETTILTGTGTIPDYIVNYTKKIKMSKNIIFRGAPGTGKTYLAKEIASYIVSGERTINYEGLTDDERSQIGFVQFHPNYDYSDFIEGLRPIMNADNSLGFKLQDGVFKAFVNRARKNYEDAHKENNVAKSDYIIQTSIEEFLDEIKFNETQLETKTGSKYLISDADSAYIYIFIPQNNVSNSIKLRITELKKLLTSDSEFENPKDVTAFFNHPKTQEDSYYFSLYCQIATIKKKLQKKHVTPAVVSNVKEKDYVFIIDEINRGEISKILGELFFSIDPGYRGKAGEIFTQYSNMHDDLDEKFYIPDNVYIIGTMNDIDRSVDSFDFAMRRRFRFIEIKASENTQMLHTLGDEMEREAIIRMNSLNAAIISEEGDLNENYQIGASYFLKLKTMTFDELWTDCLKPLLGDYIQGMYDEKGIMDKFEKAYNIETDEGNADEIN